MSQTVLTALLSGVGGLVSAILMFLGTRYTQRSASKAQTSAQEIERQKVDAQAYSEARKIWDSVIEDLHSQVTYQRAQLDEFRTRLEDVEKKRAGDRQAIHVLTEYIRDLLALLKEHNLTPPVPPEGLDLERR